MFISPITPINNNLIKFKSNHKTDQVKQSKVSSQESIYQLYDEFDENGKIFNIDEFRQKGGYFKNGHAFLLNEKFSGVVHSGFFAEKRYYIFYKNGNIYRALVNPDDNGIPKYEKEYTYDSNDNITSVVAKEYIRVDQRTNQPRYITKVASETLYKDDVIALTVFDFSKTKEAKLRNSMSDDEIINKATNIIRNAFEKRGFNEGLMPTIKFVSNEENSAGAYNTLMNLIQINLTAYRNSSEDLYQIIEHEMTHFEQAILIQSLPREVFEEESKKILANKTGKEIAKEILYLTSQNTNCTVKTPRMSKKMIEEFKNFAYLYLYKKSENALDDYFDLLNVYEYARNIDDKLDTILENSSEEQKGFFEQINILLESNPEFVLQYKSKEQAFDVLFKYSLAHMTRYLYVSNYSDRIDSKLLPKLSEEQQKEILKTFDNYIDSLEANYRLTSQMDTIGNPTEEAWELYYFSPEEVLAEVNGCQFLIKSLLKEIEEIKNSPRPDVALLENKYSLIKKAELIIEFKKAGLKYVRKKAKLKATPSDRQLTREVAELKNKLVDIEYKLVEQKFPNGIFRRTTQRN